MGARLPVLTAREIVRVLERAGFATHHITGSHAQLKHVHDPAVRVTVPMHGGDLPRGTVHAILRQARLSVDEFLVLRRG